LTYANNTHTNTRRSKHYLPHFQCKGNNQYITLPLWTAAAIFRKLPLKGVARANASREAGGRLLVQEELSLMGSGVLYGQSTYFIKKVMFISLWKAHMVTATNVGFIVQP